MINGGDGEEIAIKKKQLQSDPIYRDARGKGFCPGNWKQLVQDQEPTDTSKQPNRTRYLGHVTGYQPIRDQYFLIWSVPVVYLTVDNANRPKQINNQSELVN
eukprot:sb/3478416/